MRTISDTLTVDLHGMFRDVLRDGRGGVISDSGWQKNAIVADYRRLLAGFLHGAPTGVQGIQGLQVGAGLAAWDQPPGPPPASSRQEALVDANPFTVERDNLQMNYLVGDAVSGSPTNRLQIIATLGPGVPPWPERPEVIHPTSTLREFGLIAKLDEAPVLINYRTHPAIIKDPASTLERTIWLVF
jgi:hypothetical protein